MTTKVEVGEVVGEGLSKKEKGLMDMDNSVVIGGGHRGLNGNEKNTIKKKRNFKNYIFQSFH